MVNSLFFVLGAAVAAGLVLIIRWVRNSIEIRFSVKRRLKDPITEPLQSTPPGLNLEHCAVVIGFGPNEAFLIPGILKSGEEKIEPVDGSLTSAQEAAKQLARAGINVRILHNKCDPCIVNPLVKRRWVAFKHFPVSKTFFSEN